MDILSKEPIKFKKFNIYNCIFSPNIVKYYVCICSSVDRAPVSGTGCREFESSQVHFLRPNIVLYTDFVSFPHILIYRIGQPFRAPDFPLVDTAHHVTQFFFIITKFILWNDDYFMDRTWQNIKITV